MQETYRVQLDAFEGPLDLLLYLIRRTEVDIHDIPVAQIADGFMSALDSADLAALDIDLAGEFLVMAATLMELKSRVLARESEASTNQSTDDRIPGKDEDPRSDLIRQLLDYKKYRDAADELERRRGTWSQMSPTSPAAIDGGPLDDAIAQMREDVELEDLDLGVLVEAYRRIASTVMFDRLGEHEVLADDTPIEVYAEELLDLIRSISAQKDSARNDPGSAGSTAPSHADSQPNGLTLEQALSGRTKRQMLGVFLAMLDLMKDQRLRVRLDEGVVRLYERQETDDMTSDMTDDVTEDDMGNDDSED
jgi:segregation and condensation protein A